MDRRSLLKFFGAGAVIAPIAEGKPIIEATARIIEPPKVESVETMPSSEFLEALRRGNTVAQVKLTFPDNATPTTWDFSMVVTELNGPCKRTEVLEVTSYNDSYRRYIPGVTLTGVTLSGRIIETPTVTQCLKP